MKYIAPVLGIVVLLTVVIVLIIMNIGPSVPKQEINLLSAKYKNATVQVTMEGPVNAAEHHDSVRIAVSPAHRSVQTMRGYNYSVTGTKSYANTHAAYDAFIQAITTLGFTRENSASTHSIYSICPTGDRYVYQVYLNGQSVFRAWSTSCGNDGVGTFSGYGPQIRNLFEAQIPDYNAIAGRYGF